MENNSDEIVKRILTERLSVPDNVVEAAEHIKEQLLNGYSMAKVLGKKKVSVPSGENGIPTIITFKRLQIKADDYVRRRIVDANDIICKFIEFENEQAYDALSSQTIDYGGVNHPHRARLGRGFLLQRPHSPMAVTPWVEVPSPPVSTRLPTGHFHVAKI